MTTEQGSPTTDAGRALWNEYWPDDNDYFDPDGIDRKEAATVIAAIEREARQQALTDAIAAVDDVRFQFAAFPGDGADGDGPLGQLMAAVIDTLTRLLRGET